MIVLGLTILKTLHLVTVNVAAAGPLACVVVEWVGRRRGDLGADIAARRLALVSCWAIVVGIGLGFVLAVALWLTGETQWLGALGRLTSSRRWFAAVELAFSLACMALYLRWFDAWPRTRRWQRFGHRTVAFAAASNLLYHFPPLLVILAMLAASAEDFPQTIDSAAYRGLLLRPSVLALAVLPEFAALAAAGVALMMVAKRALGDAAPLAVRTGAAIALAATIAQLPIGVWMMTAVPGADVILGNDLPATLLFVVSVTLTFILLHHLSAAVLGDVDSGTIGRAALLMILTIGCMIGALDRARMRGSPIDHRRLTQIHLNCHDPFDRPFA